MATAPGRPGGRRWSGERHERRADRGRRAWLCRAAGGRRHGAGAWRRDRLRHQCRGGSRRCARARTRPASSRARSCDGLRHPLHRRQRRPRGLHLLHRHRADPDRRQPAARPRPHPPGLRDGWPGADAGSGRGVRVHRLSGRDRGGVRAAAGPDLRPAPGARTSSSAIRPSGSTPATGSTGSRPSPRSSPPRTSAACAGSRRCTGRW